jgi:transcriptional regulator with XRE-family HTH domain
MDTPTEDEMEEKKSLGQISRETGVSLSHISRIFAGKRKPSFATAQAIAVCLGITTDELATKLGGIDADSDK